ncbi:hypothetical protein KDW07_20410 [Burkholderia dolosa]|uniref:hypothetical protein n=1 Tax=Burkholderia dolosa TaxID=152500 RepID=UPI001B909CBA|nr:hypothetical protein [Burkholderia dolosa]MBR8459516.1 hypothetical protein [Burkholderia dolosa]MDN7421733.1 hypothetical protein [Burkholderia dolosa]
MRAQPVGAARRRSENDDIAFGTILAIARTCAETVLAASPNRCTRKTPAGAGKRCAVLLGPVRARPLGSTTAWRERHIATNCIRACRARLCSRRKGPPDDTDDVSLRARYADASVRIRLRVSDERIVVFEQQSDAVEAIRSAAIEPYARPAPVNRTLVDRPGAAAFEAVEHTPTSTGKPRRLAAPRSRRIVGRFIPRHFF